MKLARIQRLLRLIMSLQSGREQDADMLSAELQVSRRTIFRDLRLLEAAGVPYTFDHRTKGYSIGGGALLRPINLAVDEVMALLVLTRKFLSRTPVPDLDAATRAALKIEGLLPTVIQQDIGPLLEGLAVRDGPKPEAACDVDLFGRVQAAITGKRKLRIEYDFLDEGRVIDTVLHPYHLVFINRSWYVIGFSELFDEPRTFKLERFKSCRLLDSPFSDEQAFDLDDYFGNAWQMIPRDKEYRVRIRFGPKVARNVQEVCWHKTQKTKLEADGSLSFEVTVAGLDEMCWWILGYGDQAVVEEPAELREIIRRHAQSMVRCYAETDLGGATKI